MQTETINENPGMSNPQISKIIGEKWSKERPEVKEKWKRYAAEEAERHKLQHPDYQYKPKRKGSTAEPNTPKQAYYTDGERCVKCNGLRMLPFSKERQKDGQGRYESVLPTAASFEAPKRQFSQMADGDGQQRERGRSSSPIPKRRRLPDTAGSQGVLPIQVRHPQEHRKSQGHNGRTAASAGHDGRYVHVDTPLPHQYTMAPPPRPGQNSGHPSSANPGSAQSAYQYAERDGSVRLPPLKTAIDSPAQSHGFAYTPITSSLGIHSGTEKTANEQIMMIPFHRKSAVLGKICPPLSRSAKDPRGAIIAIEGSEQRSLDQVSQAVERSLIVCRDTVVTAWTGGWGLNEFSLHNQADEFKNLAPVIFKDILAWHAKSKEMVNFVTRRWITKSPETDQAARKPSPPGSQRTSPSADGSTKVPVALIKNGFSLTHSDRFACATTLALQNYQPLDHWQWMATLWRGIVGPDLVVYIKACHAEDMEKLKTVEYQKALNVMIVRVAKGAGLSEATERRLNFEIIEWITDVWPKGMLKAG